MGAWHSVVHGVTRVRCSLATEQQQKNLPDLYKNERDWLGLARHTLYDENICKCI